MKRIILIYSFLLSVVAISNAHVLLETRFKGETFEPGEIISIAWAILVEHDQLDWGLYFSKDGGDTWEPIEESLPVNQMTYDWGAPDIESSKMLIQIVQNNDVTYDYFDQSDTFSIHSQNITPVLDLKKSSLKVTISPNPVIDHTQILVQSAMKEIMMRVYNVHGQIVEDLGEFRDVHSGHSYLWETKNLRSGLYFLKVDGDDRSKILPIVISH